MSGARELVGSAPLTIRGPVGSSPMGRCDADAPRAPVCMAGKPKASAVLCKAAPPRLLPSVSARTQRPRLFQALTCFEVMIAFMPADLAQHKRKWLLVERAGSRRAARRLSLALWAHKGLHPPSSGGWRPGRRAPVPSDAAPLSRHLIRSSCSLF